MITQFKIFEKMKTFTIKGEQIIMDLSNNKIVNVDHVHSFNLSYQELIFCGIWSHISNSQKKYVIGSSYSFVEQYNRIRNEEVEKCIGQEILCIDDKAGPFGGKPTVTEGKLYTLYGYISEWNKEKCKIKNDNDKIIHISPERFCKTDINVDMNKYNL